MPSTAPSCSGPSARCRSPDALLPSGPRIRARKRGEVRSLVGRYDRNRGTKLPGGPDRVVAAHALCCAAAEEEPRLVVVGVRSGRRVDHRVRAADELKLAVVPRGALRSSMLAVADLRRGSRQRLLRVRGAEVELDHLPVAFVLVVEVVEDVEEPVLERQLAGMLRIGDDSRVGRRRRARGDQLRPLLVGAARRERISGEVEVVSEEALGEIERRRSDLDEVRPRPRPAQSDLALAEHDVHARRVVWLAVPAGLALLHESDDRRVLLRELGLGVGAGLRESSPTHREGDADDHEQPDPGSLHPHRHSITTSVILEPAGDARVADGTRTRDHRDHNPELYQLSYRHRARTGYRCRTRGLRLAATGPVAQWTERKPSKLRAEVRLLPGPSTAAVSRRRRTRGTTSSGMCGLFGTG